MPTSDSLVASADSTTLVTFRLQNLHQVGTVDLYGSWDNFRQPYPLRKDTQIGHGAWYGCHEFRSVICDGDPAHCTAPRTGGLRMDGVYWYYFVRNGSDDFHDPDSPATTDCPLRPGDMVNVLQVPVLVPEPDMIAATRNSVSWLTMDPLSRNLASRMPATPADHPYRLARKSQMPSPTLEPLRADLFNDSLARVQTAVGESIILHHLRPDMLDAESIFNKDPLVRKLAALALPPPAAAPAAAAAPEALVRPPPPNLLQTTLRRKATTGAKRPTSRIGKNPRGFQNMRPIKEFSNPFMTVANYAEQRAQTAGEFGSFKGPGLAPRPQTWAEDAGAFDRDVQRSLLRSRCERRTASAMGFLPTAPELVRKSFKSKRMASLRKSIRVSRKEKPPPMEADMLQKQHDAASKAALASPPPSELLSPASAEQQDPMSRSASTSIKRSVSLKDRFKRWSNREAPPLPLGSPTTTTHRDGDPGNLADDPVFVPTTTKNAAHRSSIVPSPVLRPSKGARPVAPVSEDSSWLLEPPAASTATAAAAEPDPTHEGRSSRLRHRLSQRFMRASSKVRAAQDSAAAPAPEPGAALHAEPTAESATKQPDMPPKPQERSIVRKISQRFLGRSNKDTSAQERPQTSARRPPSSTRPQTAKQTDADPSTTSPPQKPRLARKMSLRFFGRKTQPTSPAASPRRSRASTMNSVNLSRNTSASQETLRAVGPDVDAPPVPCIPDHFSPAVPISISKSRHQSSMTDEGIAGLTPPLLQYSEFSTPSTQTTMTGAPPSEKDFEDSRESFCEEHRLQIRELLKGSLADHPHRSSLDGEALGGFEFLGGAIG